MPPISFSRPLVRLLLLAVFPVLLQVGCNPPRTLSTTSETARRLYLEGVGMWQKFYYAEAESLFLGAINADSSFAMAWLRMAIAHRELGNEERAKQSAARAVRLSEGATAHERMFIRMWEHMIHFRHEAAARLADSLVRAYPEDKEAFLFIGRLQEIDQNIDGAIRAYQRALAIDSTYPLASMYLGYAYSSLGEQEKAIEAMNRYIRLAPDAADPRASYADILFRVGRYDEALEQYRKALELKPDYWYAFGQIAGIYLVKGRLNDAWEEFQHSLRYLPATAQREATSYHFRGNMEYLRGQYLSAVEEFRTALTLDSLHASAAFGMGLALIELGRYDEAERVGARIRTEIARRGLSRSGSMVGILLLEGRTRMKRGDLAAAIASCDSAMEYAVAVSRPSVYALMSEVHLRLRDFDAALDACEEALAPNRNNPLILLLLGKIYKASGDRQMALGISNRLRIFWKGADPDFRYLKELAALGVPPA